MKLNSFLGAAIGSIALLAAPLVSAAVVQEKLANIVAASGKVLVQKANGQQVVATRAMPLVHGDTLVVLDGSSATVKYVDSTCIEKYKSNNRVKIVRGSGCQGAEVATTTLRHGVVAMAPGAAGAAGAAAAGAAGAAAGVAGAAAAGVAGVASAGAAGLGAMGWLGLAALGIGAAAAIANNDDNNASN